MILRRRSRGESSGHRSCGLGIFSAVSVLLTLTAGASVAGAGQLPEPGLISAPVTSFDPDRDVFHFPNRLRWDYGLTQFDTPPPKEPGPDDFDARFNQHCGQMLRAARQFFYAARFAPEASRVSQGEYRELLAKVIESDPRVTRPARAPIVIPGYSDLYEFSEINVGITKEALGGSLETYRQRGNWRMIFSFSPKQRRKTAESLLASLEAGHPPIVHILRFPHITVNHNLLLYRAEATTTQIRFEAYDPNSPQVPVMLRYDRASAEFDLSPTRYWAGGTLNAYEVFHGRLY